MQFQKTHMTQRITSSQRMPVEQWRDSEQDLCHVSTASLDVCERPGRRHLVTRGQASMSAAEKELPMPLKPQPVVYTYLSNLNINTTAQDCTGQECYIRHPHSKYYCTGKYQGCTKNTAATNRFFCYYTTLNAFTLQYIS